MLKLFRSKKNVEDKQVNGEVQSQTLGRQKGKSVVEDKERNGDVKSTPASLVGTPPPERKSKLSTFSRIFKPWKWKKRKKPSEKIQKQAVDLERKISVRTTREELIERGVLKEVDPPAPVPEEKKEETSVREQREEKKKEPIVDSNVPNGGAEVGDGHVRMGQSAGRPSSGGSPHPAARPPSSCVPSHGRLPTRLHDGVRSNQESIPQGDPDEPGHMEVTVVEPKQVRVMLPMDNRDRQIPVIQRAIQIPVVHEQSGVYQAPPSPASGHAHLPQDPPPQSPLAHVAPGTPPPSSTPVVGQYEEIPASEPNLSRRPKRSAMKGAKQQVRLQEQLAQTLRQRSIMQQAGDTPRAPPKPAPKPKVRLVGSMPVIENKENYPAESTHYDHSDSSDDEIHYRDDDESSLAAKVRRQDSLARFLNNRPCRRDLMERNILPKRSEEELREKREEIGIKLTRRLSLRPTAEELEQRNILHRQTPEEYRREKEEMKKTLIRKLSFRPTVDELQERKIIKFSDYVEVTDISDYDRRADKPWTRLTPKDKALIRRELNEFKSTEMEVHEESRQFTRFHRP